MRIVRPLYPLLLAALPVLHVTANDAPGSYTLADLGVAVAVGVAGAGVLYALLALVLRRRWPLERIALVVTAAIAWFWIYRTAFRVASPRIGPAPAHFVLVVGGSVVTVAVLIWLFRRPRRIGWVTTVLGLIAGVLAVWWSADIVSHQVWNRRAMRGNPLVWQLPRALPQTVKSPTAPARDVYLIILDEYGNSSVLQEFYGFDNRPFEDSLRRLGFTIPAMVRSNYTYTSFSLPSLLNFSLLDGIWGLNTHVPHYLLQHSRAAALLKSQGYQFVFLPSQRWIATRHQPSADVEYRVWDRVGFDRGLTLVPLWRELQRISLLAFTPLGGLQHDADYVIRTFQRLQGLPPFSRPTFLFAHILSPHGPFVLDSTCQAWRSRATAVLSQEELKEAYLDQVRCINRQLLDLVPKLLARSRTPPIIVLQGDHGPRFARDFESAPTVAALSSDQLRERFGTFGAYYLPGGGERSFQDSITLVNVFPKIFNYYYGTNIPMQPDEYFTSFVGQDTLWPVDAHRLDGRASRSSISSQPPR